MGFLDSIFGKTQKINHDFFGEMRFMGGKKTDPSDYFECRRHFKPKGEIIEIGIDGDVTGPTQKQIDFFKSIEDNYKEITKSVIPVIEEEVRNWKEEFKIMDFDKEFEPVYLRIPRCDTQPIVWEISFDSDHDRNHTFAVTMSQFSATEVQIDG